MSTPRNCPIGDIAFTAIRAMADTIKARAMGCRVQGGVVVYLDAGDVHAVGRTTNDAYRIERNTMVEVIGYYSHKAKLTEIADDLVFVRDRAKVAA
jgi:hypothetical protein